MTIIFDALVSNLRSGSPSQRSVNIVSTFLMTVNCFYKGHPNSSVVNTLVPVSEVTDCSLHDISNLKFSYLQVGENFKDAPSHFTNERILIFSYLDKTHDVMVANTIIQSPSKDGLSLPNGHVDFEYMRHWVREGHIILPIFEPLSGSYAEGWEDSHPLDDLAIYSSKGFSYLTQPEVLADYLEGIAKVDGGFSNVSNALSYIREQYDKFFN